MTASDFRAPIQPRCRCRIASSLRLDFGASSTSIAIAVSARYRPGSGRCQERLKLWRSSQASSADHSGSSRYFSRSEVGPPPEGEPGGGQGAALSCAHQVGAGVVAATTGRTDESSRPQKAPPRGAFQCAREDSNLHGPFSPQGPQPKIIPGRWVFWRPRPANRGVFCTDWTPWNGWMLSLVLSRIASAAGSRSWPHAAAELSRATYRLLVDPLWMATRCSPGACRLLDQFFSVWKQREGAVGAGGEDVVGAFEDEDELVDAVVDGVGDARVLELAEVAFIALRVVMKSSIVRWIETKCRPAWPPSMVLKSRRRISGLPLRRARAEVCAWPITP